MEDIKKCIMCNKKLTSINKGKNHYKKDWNLRKFHKSCYNKKCEDERLNGLMLLLSKNNY